MTAKKGLALVIGNANYSPQPVLEACKKDAEDMKTVLERLNFDIVFGYDLNNTALKEKIDSFLNLADLYSVLTVYYSGHGVQIDGRNYFVPIDCNYTPNKTLFITTQLVGMNILLDYMEAHTDKICIMMLDACRSNPGFKYDFLGTGLAEIKAKSGSFIAFATAPNTNAGAPNANDKNSFYTECLLRHIEHPNIKIEDMFKLVRADVEDLTQKSQTPWENTSLNDDFYFNVMTDDEIDDKIYKSLRDAYCAETLIFLSVLLGRTISDIMRIYEHIKSEKPGGIYLEKESFEKNILRQVLGMGFIFSNYRWVYKDIPVLMGDFFHTTEYTEV